MITRLLVANRGEIARRIFATCRELGIETVAVFSDPDAGADHVREADLAVRLPGSTAADTYLDAAAVVAAAVRAGADALHPGYGFLSENGAFARAVIDAGLCWVGPAPVAIEAMGSKIEAKRLMAAAGVPLLTSLDPATVTQADLPVLIKASAGGGGRGMRIVHELSDLPHQLAAAGAEAAAAFGDASVFLEPYLARGHHVEVQVLADAHGTVWAVGERECSVQRRHQKVVEEAPSPLVERVAGMRERLYDAAITATAQLGYLGAGTVEFLADDTGRLVFRAMNTPLQVEHPVTPSTTRRDLVAWQLAIADGAALPAQQPARRGHAVEARLYAEDPAHGWRPQPGSLLRFCVPAGDGVRVDSAVADGGAVEISRFYDPMIAKVIGYGPDRPTAVRRLRRALLGTRVDGLMTNRDQLVRILDDADFAAGDTTTALLAPERADLQRPLLEAGEVGAAATAAALATGLRRRPFEAVAPGWRNLASQTRLHRYRHGSSDLEVELRTVRGQVCVVDPAQIVVVDVSTEQVVLEVSGVQRSFTVTHHDAHGLVSVGSSRGWIDLAPVPRFPDLATSVPAGSLLSPMPGTVIAAAVQVGDRVATGQLIVTVEAMKMQHAVTAPTPGIVTALPVPVGGQTDTGTVLAVLSPVEDSPEHATHPDEHDRGAE